MLRRSGFWQACLAAAEWTHALGIVVRDKITELTGKEDLSELVGVCQAAIAAGNKDFERIYEGVFKIIQSGEGESLEKYDTAVQKLVAPIEGAWEKGVKGRAKQRAGLEADGSSPASRTSAIGIGGSRRSQTAARARPASRRSTPAGRRASL